MKKKLLAIAIGAALGAGPMAAQAGSDIKVKWFGFTQITAEVGELKDGNTNDGLRFGADRIRIGYKMKVGNVFGKLQVDFNKDASDPIETEWNDKDSDGVIDPGELESATKPKVKIPEIIKDAEVGYKFSNAAKVKAGIFKTPVGMDFNTSGKKLDITKRGMEKALVLERAPGLMLSGRKIGGGFGYDIGVFNPTVRSSAVSGGTVGDNLAWAGRVMYDMGKMLHLEAYYGKSEEAGGAGSQDYTVWGLAGRYRSGPFTVKFEYIDGENVKGSNAWDQQVWYLHGGWRVNKMNEFVIRHYSGESEKSGTSTDLSNTYVGWNIFLGPKDHNARIQLNYVFVGGDEKTWSGVSGGKSSGGYTADGFIAQFQTSF